MQGLQVDRVTVLPLVVENRVLGWMFFLTITVFWRKTFFGSTAPLFIDDWAMLRRHSLLIFAFLAFTWAEQITLLEVLVITKAKLFRATVEWLLLS